MKRTEILPAIEKAFNNREAIGSNRIVFTWEKNHIVCIDALGPKGYEIVFGNYAINTILCGLTEKEWSLLEAKVARFLVQKGFYE